VVWEQRSRVAIWPDAEQDEVEHWEARRVLRGELDDQLAFVRVNELLDVAEEGGIDVMNVSERDIDFREEDIHSEFVVGVFVVERHNSLIGIVNLPVDTLSVRPGTWSSNCILTICPI